MKRFLAGFICLICLSLFGGQAWADECKEGSKVLISPVSKDIQIGPGQVVDESFIVKNRSNRDARFRIYAAPYTDAEGDDKFSTETIYTQISRWIKFFDISGGQLDSLEIKLPACSEREVKFRVTTPDTVPDGGQYAVIFVENKNEGDAVITSAARVGMLLNGHVSGGKTISDVTVADLTLQRETSKALKGKNGKNLEQAVIYGSTAVTNNGNIDVEVKTTLVVKSLLGREVYNHTEAISLLPGAATRKITDIWEETPAFGLFIAEYTVETVKGVTETISQVFLIVPVPFIILAVIALIIVAIGVIRLTRKAWRRRQKYHFK